MKHYLERQMMDVALEAFQNAFTEPIQFTQGKYELRLNQHKRVDAIVDFKGFGVEKKYCVEIKRRVTKPILGDLLLFRNDLPHPLLLITEHVNDFMADCLKAEKIEFLDTAGNAFIDQAPLYIFIKGNKYQEEVFPRKKTQAFTPAGLKVVFIFLYNNRLLNGTYRDIAKNAGIALGAVGKIIADLVKLGFLMKTKGEERILLQKEKLFDRWQDEFAEKLGQKLFLGKFTGKTNWWQEKELNPHQAQWGGETAAARLTKFLKPEKTTVYVNPNNLEDFLLENKLRRDDHGDIEIYERFWALRENDLRETVPEFLVYADLIATGDGRNIETAKIIFDKYVTEYIR